MRFTINLATRTYLDYRVVNRVFIAAMVVLLALLAWGVARVSWNMGELRRLKAENAGFEASLESRPSGVSEQDYKRMIASIRFYNDVIEHKTYNWLGLLEQVEKATPEGIALASLTPEKKGTELKIEGRSRGTATEAEKKGTALKIEGRAKGFADVRRYLEKLDASGEFTDIMLMSHHDMAVGEKGKGVQFSISCRAVNR